MDLIYSSCFGIYLTQYTKLNNFSVKFVNKKEKRRWFRGWLRNWLSLLLCVGHYSSTFIGIKPSVSIFLNSLQENAKYCVILVSKTVDPRAGGLLGFRNIESLIFDVFLSETEKQ